MSRVEAIVIDADPAKGLVPGLSKIQVDVEKVKAELAELRQRCSRNRLLASRISAAPPS